MDRSIFIHKLNASSFLEVIRRNRAQHLGRVRHRYLLCTAILAARRKELDKLQQENLDTTKLQRMILRLEASQAAHRKLIRKLEAD